MAATYEPIATTTLTSSQSTITLSSIPQTYTDLRLSIFAYGSGSVDIRLNGTTTPYGQIWLGGSSTTADSSKINGLTTILLTNYSSLSTTVPSIASVDVFSYSSTAFAKMSLITYSSDKSGSGSVERSVASWNNTAAITSITLLSSFTAGTTVSLYGIKAA